MSRLAKVVALLVAFSAPARADSFSPVVFVDESAARGIQPFTMAFGMGGGVAVADFDDDGDLDMFVPSEAGFPDQLYRNLGDGTFEEIASAAGVASLARGRTALWFDYDGDHALDLFVAGDCMDADPSCLDTPTLTLYRQTGAAQFQDVSVAAGLGGDRVDNLDLSRGGAAVGDLNRDGYLDLIVGLWEGRSAVFLNNGDGTFMEIAVASGIGGSDLGHWQPVLYDFDGNGWLDIFWAIDFQENRLWMNQGDHTFLETAVAAGVDNPWNDMGVALGDYDNDLDPDLYVTNITGGGRHSVLLRNDSSLPSLSFNEVATTLGVEDAGWGWGTTFFDADNDGWQDLAATNGYIGPWSDDSSRFFHNQASTPAAFVDVTDTSGFDDTFWGSALAAVDLDRDGFLNLVQTCQAVDGGTSALHVLDNHPSVPAVFYHYLVVRPRMTGPNHRAIGAVVRVEIPGVQMMRPITAGISFLTQEPAEAHFGVGSNTVVSRVVIDWPDGQQSELTDVAVDQVLTVTIDPDTDGDGQADAVDGDDDADGVADAADCAPTASEAWAVPGPATGITLSGSAGDTTVSWTPPGAPGGTVVYYDVIASLAADDLSAAASCVGSNTRTTSVQEGTVVPRGEVLYVTVQAGNACGESGIGTGSGAAPRSARRCPW